jgi:SAM-dependent methyltransferase
MPSSTERFSDRVNNYIRYRPGYPTEVISLLERETGLIPTQCVADVGSGTGLSAMLFLRNGNPVFGVEPNTDMRQAAEQLLAGYPNFTSVNGTAEATTLPDQSVKLVVAGQAFHWFRPQETKAEFRRILQPGGWVVLIWNERETDSAFLKEYENFLLNYSTDYQEIDHRNVDEKVLEPFFGSAGYQLHTLPNYQEFDVNGLNGRYLSCSYAYPEAHPRYPEAMTQLGRLFDRYQQNGSVRMDYRTLVYVGRLD